MDIKEDVRIWTGLTWDCVGSDDGLLKTRQQPFIFSHEEELFDGLKDV